MPFQKEFALHAELAIGAPDLLDGSGRVDPLQMSVELLLAGTPELAEVAPQAQVGPLQVGPAGPKVAESAERKENISFFFRIIRISRIILI